MKKRLITLLLALVMIIGMLPVCALAADAEVPESAKHTLNIGGQMLASWQNGQFGQIGNRFGIYNVEYVCQRCLENPTHNDGENGTYHTVLARDLAYLIPQMQEKANGINVSAWANSHVAIIGLTGEKDHENTTSENPDIHSFYAEENQEVEVKGGQVFYIVAPVFGEVDVTCESDSAHGTRTYDLEKGTFTTAQTSLNAQGQITCQLTINKAPYIEKYNADVTGSTHRDACTDPEVTTVTLELHSKNKYDAKQNDWDTADHAKINVKCAPDAPDAEMIDAVDNPISPILAALNKATPKLNTRDHFAYVQGYPDGTVKPAGSITRAEVAAILFRLMDADSRSLYYATASGFRDVDSTKWYNTYVATLNNAGVITDSRTGYFRPNDAITRAELAAMLAQFAEKKSAAIYFSDVSAGYWAANAIALTANLGWINGYPDGTFGPDKTVTRAELMAMVNRATGRAPKSTGALLSGMKTWKDNADTARWYYLDVQEATNSHTYLGAPTETWTSLTTTPDWSQYE